MTLPDGSCQAAGVPPDACGDGFTADADGCAPILPAGPCPPGLMALPGDTTCRPVAPCGAGTWGDIPVDPATQYVDAAFGGVGKGTAAEPFSTIGEALAAAQKGAIVAVAAGSYAEDLTISKPVVLWGVCPELVEIVGSSAAIAAIDVRAGGTGSEIRSLAITGDSAGVGASGPDALLVDSVWVHDLTRSALDAESTLGSTTVTLHRFLAEATESYGLFVQGADVAMSDVVVRDVAAGAQGAGRGINVQLHPEDGTRAHVTVDRFVVERTHEIGIFVAAADLALSRGVVRDIAPNAAGAGGRGIEIEDYPPKHASTSVQVDTLVVERATDVGIAAAGSDVVIERTTVRDTRPRQSDGKLGRGLGAQDHELPGSLTVRWSLVERSLDVGIFVGGVPTTLEGVRVRATAAQEADSTGGRALNVQYGVDPTRRGSATARWSIFEQSFDQGAIVVGSDASFESVRISDTAPRPSDGHYGDGVAAIAQNGPAKVDLLGVLVEGSARAGLACFGCTASVTTSELECNTIALDGEPFSDLAPTFLDAGDNTCGCKGAKEPCKVLTSELEPPSPSGG